ncbi:MAG: alpha/beta fold hydrolase [Oscillospiraceae bacterium]|nr:alpha/beta fold hydrolase [Oscillospiraceae bacterium]
MKKAFTLILVVLFAFLAVEPAFAAVPASPSVPAITEPNPFAAYNGSAAKTGIPVETAETDSFSMDYIRFGNGEKTLVILPGLSVQSVMGSADAVAEAFQTYTDEFTVYLFDQRKELPPAYSIHEMARDTAEAVRTLGLDHVVLAGFSMGGMTAMDMAIHNPGLADKLVLGSTSARITEDQYETINKWVQLAKAGNTEELYLAFGEALYPEEIFRQSREFLIEAAKTVTNEELDHFIILAEGIRAFDDLDALDEISCPVLVIGDEDDHVLGAEASRQIAAHLGGRPDVELYMYDGYGHAVYDTAPDYRERVLNFLVSEEGGEPAAEASENRPKPTWDRIPTENSPEWVEKLDAARDADQLFVVAGVGETTAYVSMHEKDASGTWKQIMTTPGFMNELGKTKEGDSKTPVGVFRFNAAFGIKEDPGCAIPYLQVTEDNYWSGDAREGYHYNQMVSIKDYPDLDLKDSEWIVDYPIHYQYCLNISYNEEGIPGLGSAIFLHCLGPCKPYTGGCVAIPRDQMITVMQHVSPDCVVVIDTLENLSPETWADWGFAPAEDGKILD